MSICSRWYLLRCTHILNFVWICRAARFLPTSPLNIVFGSFNWGTTSSKFTRQFTISSIVYFLFTS